MKLHMTDGQSRITVHFDEHLDHKACGVIRSSKTPVSKALSFAKKRLGVDCLYPAPGLALEGL